MTKKFKVQPGICPVIQEALRARCLSMQEEQKEVFIFDETAAKRALAYNAAEDCIVGLVDVGSGTEPHRRLDAADEVMIAMVRSVFEAWKQPVAYWPSCRKLTAVDFKKIFQAAIVAVQQAGFSVRMVLVDGLGKNRAAMEMMGSSLQRPWFFLNGQKIYTISDVCHLIKCLRNALLKYLLQLRNGAVVNKEYIDRFIRLDMQLTPRIAKKVTEVTLNPNNYQKMNVGTALALFRPEVASGISLCSILDYLPKDAVFTAKFLEKVHSLFESQNGTEVVENPAPGQLKCAVTASSDHVNLWKEMIHEIQGWHFIGSKNLSFPENWVMSLKALLYL